MTRKPKQLISILLCVMMVGTIFSACHDRMRSNGGEVSETTTTTTTTTTTATTTEDLSTTFPEKPTGTVYKGLIKDTESDYPYKIAEYATYYNSSNATRSANLKNAADKVNYIVVPDSQVFSFNQTVGKRTVVAGYDEAPVIQDGELVDGLGGGVCQVSSTIFEAVLRANCKIVARTNHSLKVGYVPLGGDATVDWNSKDFQFKNDLGTDIRLRMECASGKLTCTVWAKDDVTVGDVKIDITESGEDYVLTRTVNGEKNYETKSHYQEPKTTEATSN